jgi:alpha-N-arabinofuranosidase
VPGTWQRKGSSTDFTEADWHTTLRKALWMDERVTRHAAEVDKADPQKCNGMIVDECGTWFDSEPGSTPGFLYQQNTLRDALVAGITLNIFNQHADRVKMANIAQAINVLQAMILTDKEKMIVTPTYHVFEMFTVHHDATLLPVELKCPDYSYDGNGIPGVSVSASRDVQGKVHVPFCNLNPMSGVDVEAAIAGLKATNISGRVLTAAVMNAHNTFDQPEVVKPAEFRGAKLTEQGFAATLPSKSVVVLDIAADLTRKTELGLKWE